MSDTDEEGLEGLGREQEITECLRAYVLIFRNNGNSFFKDNMILKDDEHTNTICTIVSYVTLRCVSLKVCDYSNKIVFNNLPIRRKQYEAIDSGRSNDQHNKCLDGKLHSKMKQKKKSLGERKELATTTDRRDMEVSGEKITNLTKSNQGEVRDCRVKDTAGEGYNRLPTSNSKKKVTRRKREITPQPKLVRATAQHKRRHLTCTVGDRRAQRRRLVTEG